MKLTNKVKLVCRKCDRTENVDKDEIDTSYKWKTIRVLFNNGFHDKQYLCPTCSLHDPIPQDQLQWLYDKLCGLYFQGAPITADGIFTISENNETTRKQQTWHINNLLDCINLRSLEKNLEEAIGIIKNKISLLKVTQEYRGNTNRFAAEIEEQLSFLKEASPSLESILKEWLDKYESSRLDRFLKE